MEQKPLEQKCYKNVNTLYKELEVYRKIWLKKLCHSEQSISK